MFSRAILVVRDFFCAVVQPPAGGCIPSLSPVFILTLPHSASGHLEVIFRDRKVVLVGNSRRITQRLAHHVRGQPLLQLVEWTCQCLSKLDLTHWNKVVATLFKVLKTFSIYSYRYE